MQRLSEQVKLVLSGKVAQQGRLDRRLAQRKLYNLANKTEMFTVSKVAYAMGNYNHVRAYIEGNLLTIEYH